MTPMLHVRQSVGHQLGLNVLVLMTRMSPETCMMATRQRRFPTGDQCRVCPCVIDELCRLLTSCMSVSLHTYCAVMQLFCGHVDAIKGQQALCCLHNISHLYTGMYRHAVSHRLQLFTLVACYPHVTLLYHATLQTSATDSMTATCMCDVQR